MVGRRAAPSPSPTPSRGVSLPKLVTDPIWSLRPWPVTVQIAGEDVTIPAMPAADWLAVLMTPGLDSGDVFPGMLEEEDRSYVEDRLHAGFLDVEEFLRLGLEIISTVSGRPWWVSLRLIATASQSWDALGGELVNFDAERLSLAGWLDALFMLIVRNIDDEKRTMFLMKLELPPQGWGEEEPKSLEMSADAFMAMASD